jgi:hypothetical protein
MQLKCQRNTCALLSDSIKFVIAANVLLSTAVPKANQVIEDSPDILQPLSERMAIFGALHGSKFPNYMAEHVLVSFSHLFEGLVLKNALQSNFDQHHTYYYFRNIRQRFLM